jgi:NDP-4-keto-2,6-dideoxyhexose 3-C-methyltransferase
MSNQEPTLCSACRACGHPRLRQLFSLGNHYISDFVSLGQAKSGPTCPVTLIMCEKCRLVQQQYTAPPDLLYRRHYHYRSGTTATMRAALRDVTSAIEERVPLSQGDIVLDIGSNTGELLRSYAKPDLVKVGVEPALNFQNEGSQGGIHLISDFWGTQRCLEAYHSLQCPSPNASGNTGLAKAITACGMLYDLDKPDPFIAHVAQVLAPAGVFVAQLMCLRQMIETYDVGNLNIEHLLFYSLTSLIDLLGTHGLAIYDVEENSVNNGSYRLWCCHADQVKSFSVRTPGAPQRRSRALAAEEVMRLDEPRTLTKWWTQGEERRDSLRRLLHWCYFNKKSVACLGASTKGSTLLQWWGLTRDHIEFASERDPAKWGKVMTGCGIPIVSEMAARERRPDLQLVLPYFFRNEIVEREREYLASGGKLVFPLPELQVVGADGVETLPSSERR